jgi:hypothetical protein
LRIFIADHATFDADFLNSVWIAAIPGFVGATAISYLTPPRLADRLWTSWLFFMPVGGFIVPLYSLQDWFTRQAAAEDSRLKRCRCNVGPPRAAGRVCRRRIRSGLSR